MKRLTILILFTSTAVLLSSCGVHLGLSKILSGGSSSKSTSGATTVKATHTAPANPDAVSIVGGKYRPKNLTVKVGTTVTWTNNDTKSESVTSNVPGVFESGALKPGATFQYTFSTAGTFPYHSTASSSTFGSVTVTP